MNGCAPGLTLKERLWVTWKWSIIIEGLPAKRAYIAFLADFRFFLQDQANFWQTDRILAALSFESRENSTRAEIWERIVYNVHRLL